MMIGGLQKFSLLDYPDHISAIIFTQGCNFRCQYCYNPMLVLPQGESKPKTKIEKKSEKGHSLIKEDDLFAFLKKRIGKLDAVVVTGGEPTMHSDLPIFIKKIKNLGLKVKLDTNGTNTKMIKKLVNEKLIDYIAMDIKASPETYESVVEVPVDLRQIEESIIIIKTSGLPYEFRTTVVPGLTSKDEVGKMGQMIKGSNKWFLQQFKSDMDLLNEKLQGNKSFSTKEMDELQVEGKKYVNICSTR